MSRVAILWDESFLWGLMALRSFQKLGFEPKVVLARDLAGGALDGFDVLFVPGGWASDKTVALGHEGAGAIRGFVRSGGGYLGFCGGAGLALDVEGGLALTHVTRVPTRHRVPSFSGRIDLVPEEPGHPIWAGIKRPYTFHAWWPGQFHIGEGDGVKVVAAYGKPGKDFSLADLPAGDVAGYDDGWEKWEGAYGINLDPARLEGEPAIIEAGYGAGKAVLSYLHLETPGDRKGNQALLNILKYLKPGKRASNPPLPYSLPRNGGRGWGGGVKGKVKLYTISPDALKASGEMMKAAREFIAFGERNFLWYWRNSWVLQWRRGVRGVEYSMLYGMINEISVSLKARPASADPDASEKLLFLNAGVVPFFEDAKSLLLKERYALMNGGMSSIRSDDPEVARLRERLFSSSKRFGGEFKAVLNLLDEVVRGVIL